MEIPGLSGAARGRLEAVATGAAGVANPVDLGAGAGPESFGRAAACLAGSGEVDALLVITASTAVTDTDGALAALEAALDQAPGLPYLSVVVGTSTPAPGRRATRFRSVDAAVRSFGHAQRHAAWLRSAPERVRLRAEAVGAEDRAASSAGSGEGRWLDAAQAEELLASAGVRPAPYAVVRTVRDVAEAVRRLGLPLAVKSADPALVHKTEARQVRTGLRTRRAVTDAVRAVREAARDPHAPVLLQRQVAGPELALGVTRDPTFGPLVMVASGGTRLDLWDDQVFLMPPLDRADVAAALASLRTWPLVTGFRGGRALDVDAVVELVLRLGRWVLEHPEVEELDLNPVMVTDDGPVCVDAKVRARG
ncbi:acetate--CoA ligase family protein [Nocardioides panacis]|uniref:Acetate--CoA ligase family protein n=1 Tax=Nocardioides panacis TaxID=2849501 RepID=A0A975T115_9ACTN|nr:acetate--CoA ligase family protein [Nocardioides panacis]QWZ09655.1 acetate--CoA ligase family protein [Nocardioides panacis]